MTTYLIPGGVFIACVLIVWLVVIPRIVNKLVDKKFDDRVEDFHELLRSMHATEIEPLQKQVAKHHEALLTYPPVIKELQANIDDLYSEGQQRPRESFDDEDAIIEVPTRPKF